MLRFSSPGGGAGDFVFFIEASWIAHTWQTGSPGTHGKNRNRLIEADGSPSKSTFISVCSSSPFAKGTTVEMVVSFSSSKQESLLLLLLRLLWHTERLKLLPRLLQIIIHDDSIVHTRCLGKLQFVLRLRQALEDRLLLVCRAAA